MSQLVAMMMRAGVLTAAQAQEARAQQVVYGDRIGTNLLDLGFADETLLAQALGALHGVPYAAGPTADTGPTLARSLPAAAAARLNAVPARWDGTVLHVFMMEPRNSRAIGELESLLKRRISPVVVVEARMWELLRKHYKVRRGLRALALDGDPLARAQQLLKQATQKAAVPPPAPSLAQAQPQAPGLAPPPNTGVAAMEELSSEEDFNALYQRAPPTGGTQTATERAMAQAEAAASRRTQSSDAIPAVQAPPPPPAQRTSLSDAPVIAGTLLLDTPPAAPPPPAAPAVARPPAMAAQGPVVDGIPLDGPRVTPPPPAPPPPAPTTAAQAGALQWRTQPIPPAAMPPVQVPPPPAPPAPPVVAALANAAGTATPVVAFAPATDAPDFGVPLSQAGHAAEAPPTDEISLEIDFDERREAPPTTPLTFVQAKEALAGVEDRNAIARTVLRYAITPFKRAVLLTVQKDLMLGWDALGEGVSQEAVERVILPVQQPSIFRVALEARAHYLGPVPKQAVNYLFLKLIGGKVPRSAFVIPVVVRGKVVNLLYCDNGGGQEATVDVGELLILAQHINRSYEALLKKAS